MSRTLGGIRTDPDTGAPPARVGRDWLLAAAVAGTSAIEVVVRDDLTWPPVALALGLLLAGAVLWRRTHPLTMVAVSFGALLAIDSTTALTGNPPFNPYAGVVVLVLVYALFRWATSRQAAIGMAIVLAEWLLVTTTDITGAAEAVGGLVVLLLAAALGLLVRYRGLARTEQLHRIRAHERELLARELHDTVAHHVSAIAIQAQAGQVLVKSGNPDGAADALGLIEEQASRTLVEMRAMVGALRRGDSSDTTAAGGLADLQALATADGTPGLRVEIQHTGELDDLRPPVQAALYRVAQEAVTNARRHARSATRVLVRVSGDPDVVRLEVSDDGERGLPGTAAGFGLVGMAERVTLLGGTWAAGPDPDRGWTVSATIHRNGGTA